MQEPYPTLLEQLYSPYSYPPPPFASLSKGRGEGYESPGSYRFAKKPVLAPPYRIPLAWLTK